MLSEFCLVVTLCSGSDSVEGVDVLPKALLFRFTS